MSQPTGPMSMAPDGVLRSLPDEVLLLIAESCEKSDVTRLARTCRRLHQISVRALYTISIVEEQKYALFFGIIKQIPSTVRTALWAGVDPNTRWQPARHATDIRNRFLSPLAKASEWKEMLLGEETCDEFQAGSLTAWHWSPIHLVVFTGNMEILDILLASGAKINSSSFGACFCERESWRTRGNGTDPTFGTYASRPRFFSTFHVAVCCGHIDIAQRLLQAGAAMDMEVHLEIPGVDNRLDLGLHPLHVACAAGALSVVKWLLTQPGCAELEVQDASQCTPLDYAYIYSHWDCVDFLLSKGIDINRPTQLAEGRTLLHHAISSLRLYDGTHLIERGIRVTNDPSFVDYNNFDILEDEDEDESLINKPTLYLLCETPWVHDASVRKALKESPRALNSNYELDQTNGGLWLMDHCIATGVDYEASYNDATPLSVAALNGNEAAVDRLIAHGANVNGSPRALWTPLFQVYGLMSSNESRRIALTLLNTGASAIVTGTMYSGFASHTGTVWPRHEIFSQTTDPEEVEMERKIVNRLLDMGLNPIHADSNPPPLFRLLLAGQRDIFKEIVLRCGPKRFLGDWDEFWSFLGPRPAFKDIVDFLVEFDTSGRFAQFVARNVQVISRRGENRTLPMMI